MGSPLRGGILPPSDAGVEGAPLASGEAAADIVVVGAPVYTVDAARRWAGALAIRGRHIVAAGTEADARGLIGPRTQIVELEGGLVVPGFQDAHVHLLHGGLAEARCDLHDLSGRVEYARAISDYASDNPDAEWILGSGWSMDAFPGGTPGRNELDAVVPDRPAFIVNRDGHGAWVNSRALERAGIDATTADPPDGRIEREDGGAPSGTLHEGAMRLVQDLVPAAAVGELVEALARAQSRLHALGVTAWNEASVERDDLDAYAKLSTDGRLTGRARLSLLWERGRGEEQLDDLIEARERARAAGLDAGNVKIFLDGVAENFTASLLEPYLDASGAPTNNRGLRMIEPEALQHHVTLVDAAGFDVHFHAIGDRAVRDALDAVEAAVRANGMRDARHHIAHIQLIDPVDIPRFRALRVVANAQPFWACNEPQMRDLTVPFLGSERAQLQYPFGALRRAGASLAFGSDWPVTTPDPLLEMQVAITRVPPDEPDLEPLLPKERLDLPAALDAFTIGAAYVNRLDRQTGSIEAGKLADIAVLDRDLFALDAGDIGDARVVLTVVDGQPVYDPDGRTADRGSRGGSATTGRGADG